MKRRFSLFTYPVMDMKAAEAELNRRAAKGWRLEKIWMGLLAVFVPAHVPVRYCLDWCDNVKDTERMDYKELLSQAGWEHRMELPYWNLYEAPAGTAPIQTDGELEYQRFRDKVMRRMVRGIPLTLLVVGIQLLNIIAQSGEFGAMSALMWASTLHMMLALLLLLPLWGLGGLAWLGRMALRLRQWRQAAREDGPTPVPGRWSGLAAALLTLAGWLSVVLVCAAAVWDMTTNCVPTLPFAGVFLLCAGILFARSLWERHQTKWVRRMASLCLATALCGGAGGMVFFRQAETTLLEPPLSDLHLLPGVTEVWSLWENRNNAATSLLSCTDWDELEPDGETGFGIHETVLGVRMETPVRGTAWRARWPWLAEWAASLQRGGMEPVEGYPGVWHRETGKGELWLLRRDTLVLRVKNDLEPLGEDWLADMLAQMEEEAP